MEPLPSVRRLHFAAPLCLADQETQQCLNTRHPFCFDYPSDLRLFFPWLPAVRLAPSLNASDNANAVIHDNDVEAIETPTSAAHGNSARSKCLCGRCPFVDVVDCFVEDLVGVAIEGIYLKPLQTTGRTRIVDPAIAAVAIIWRGRASGTILEVRDDAQSRQTILDFAVLGDQEFVITLPVEAGKRVVIAAGSFSKYCRDLQGLTVQHKRDSPTLSSEQDAGSRQLAPVDKCRWQYDATWPFLSRKESPSNETAMKLVRVPGQVKVAIACGVELGEHVGELHGVGWTDPSVNGDEGVLVTFAFGEGTKGTRDFPLHGPTGPGPFPIYTGFHVRDGKGGTPLPWPLDANSRGADLPPALVVL